jgi:preprotein translocase subunit SecA
MCWDCGGCIQEGITICERQKAYAADITYVTAREAGFDYLRDFLCLHKEDLVHRPPARLWGYPP